MRIDPSVGPVHKVQLLIRRSDTTAHYVGDLVYVDGLPMVVIEWRSGAAGEVPDVTVRLDPAELRRLDAGDIEFLYDRTIEDPRKLN